MHLIHGAETSASALDRWHQDSRRIARNGVTKLHTVTGRRRLIPDSANDWQRFTALVNTPVQGGCADGMKLALDLISARLSAGARIISTVHLEVIVEAPDELAANAREAVRTAMIEAMSTLFPQVPIEVEASICAHWGEK